MTPHKRKNILLAASALLGVAIVASIVLGVALPLVPPPSQTITKPRPSGANRQATKPATLDRFAVIYQKDVRRPLFDPKPVVYQPPPPPPPPKPTAKLVGTVADPGFACAIFRSGSGEDKVVPVGQTYEGIEVLEVKDTEAKVKFAGLPLVLKVEKKVEP